MTVRRWVKWFVRSTLLVGLGLGALYGWWRMGGRPQRSGSARVPALEAPVEVRFDRFGVPHIRAEHSRDAARAMGWLHANDRLGQMELMRRYVRGRLAEVAGESAVRSDRSVRELRFPQTVEALLGALEPESRALLDAYAEGVNAWLAARGGDLPPDVRLMRIRPEPWSARDSLCVQMMMSQMLSHSVARELSRLGWVHSLGSRRASVLIGDPLANVPSGVLERMARQYAEQAVPARAERVLETSNGSNNWAVDSSRSANAHALVANDPHLGIGLPSIWFQAQVRAADYEAAGFTIPGLPLIVIGQGPKLAWSFTNSELDVCDAFLERLDAEGRAVERDGEWVPLRVERERIEVRGGASVEFDALSTEIGPLLTWGVGLRYSLAWTGAMAFDPLRPFLELARASSVDDVPGIVASFVGPPQNLVCGDAQGAILHTLMGRNVERGAGDGRVPLPAADRSLHWRGLRPREHAPSTSRPASGWLVTANNDLRPPTADYPYPLDAATPHRAERIAERLAERERWTPGQLAELQNDTVSLYAREIVAALLEVASVEGQPPEPDARRALDALASWNGDLALTGTSALYHLFEARLDEWIAALLGRSLSHPERDRVRLEAMYGRLDPLFLTGEGGPSTGLLARRAKLLETLAAAWREGVQAMGADLERWDYGGLHTWTPQHNLDSIPVLGRAFSIGSFRAPGNGTSPCVFSGPRRRDAHDRPRTAVVHGASLRFVADCAAPDSSLAILPGGQSGHPFDAHYADQVAFFLAGELRPVAWRPATIEAATVSLLALRP